VSGHSEKSHRHSLRPTTQQHSGGSEALFGLLRGYWYRATKSQFDYPAGLGAAYNLNVFKWRSREQRFEAHLCVGLKFLSQKFASVACAVWVGKGSCDGSKQGRILATHLYFQALEAANSLAAPMFGDGGGGLGSNFLRHDRRLPKMFPEI
jgi:hypothetical protein